MILYSHSSCFAGLPESGPQIAPEHKENKKDHLGFKRRNNLLFRDAVGTSLLKDDFSRVAIWWLVFLVLGVVAYPVAGLIFGRFHDGGFIFSKAIGLSGAGILMWFLSSLKIMKFTRTNALISVGILLLINVVILVTLLSFLTSTSFRQRLIVLKSWKAFFPILKIFFKLMEFTPPCLGLNVIGRYRSHWQKISSWCRRNSIFQM